MICAAARSWYQQSLVLTLELGERYITPYNLEGLADVLAAQGEPIGQHGCGEQQKCCAKQRLRWHLLIVLAMSRRCHSQDHLGEQAFTSAWTEGRTMTPEQAAYWATPGLLQSKPVSAVKQHPSLTSPNRLTAREMDVLRLLAQGLTSAQIAKQLVIGVVTVNFHVRSIYSKLGVSSRSAATRYAIEHQLV